MLFGEKVAYFKEDKFLRLILDARLNWSTQIKKIIDRARITLWTSQRMMGRT